MGPLIKSVTLKKTLKAWLCLKEGLLLFQLKPGYNDNKTRSYLLL